MFSRRSNSLFAVLGLLLASALLLGSCAPVPSVDAAAVTPATAQATGTPGTSSETHTITVVGRGEVRAKPDIAHSNIGIEVLSPTVSDAMSKARTQMADVLKALKDAGIADKDVQTSNFSTTFERGPVEKTAVGTSASDTSGGQYRVSNMVRVTIRDLDKVGAVVDAAVNAGANNVWGIDFGLDQTDTLEAQAREQAVSDAQARAQSLAKLNGVALGNVIAVSEVIGNGASPMYAAADVARGMGGGGTPVEPGEVTLTTQIQVVYAIQ